MLREKDVLISDKKASGTLINKYFVHITVDLDLKRDSQTLFGTPTSLDGILEKFDCHQSILKIQEALNMLYKLSFH